MLKKIFTKNKSQSRAILIAAMVLCVNFAACGIRQDPSSVNRTISQSTSYTDQPTVTPTITPIVIPTVKVNPAITTSPAPSPQSSRSATPTATPKPDPTVTPAPTVTLKPNPSATISPRPTASPTPTIQAGIGDSSVLNENFYWISLDEHLKRRITGISYPADDSDILIHYDDLRYIRLLHYDFEGDVNEGELIVHAILADEVMEIFYQLYLAKYPLTSVLLVDDFDQTADDTLSMEANNTSAFNYRYVTGTRTLSRHSFGAAVDINPMLNPYIVGDRIIPENGALYADRSWDFPGKIDHDDLCYQLFIDQGWTWGGDWSGDKDYQHFSKKINP